MTTAAELLSHLRRTGIRVWADGDELRCSAPHGQLTVGIVAELRAQKAGILEILQGCKSGATAAASPISRVPRDGELPLSFAQQGLWIVDQLDPNRATYNIPIALRLTGPLDVAALERCLNEIVGRHEALRTTYRTAAGGYPVLGVAVQRIEAVASLKLGVRDLCGLPAEERERELRRLLAEEARRPFDLSQDLMLRAGVLRLDEQEHVCTMTFHHIAADGWSLGVFFRELTALYAAWSGEQGAGSRADLLSPRSKLPAPGSRPSPLRELPIQYADFAAWQRKWLQGNVGEERLAYWKRRLAGAPPVLELPTDRPRPAIQTHRGARERLVLDEGLANALRRLGQQESVTPFMLLLAAFQTLLHRYSGQEDLVVGTPVAGRDRLETEELIGFFVNMLALRTDLSGNPTFRELLARVRETTLGAYAHQDLPFEKLVAELNPERNLSYSPLCQVMFVLQNAPREPLRLSGLKVSGEDVESHTAKFDLTLSMSADGERLCGVLEYSTDLFERATIQRMLGHFQRLLEGIAADPGRRIGELPLLTEAERHQLLVEWNDTRADYPNDRCIQQLFEEQAGRTPEATAVVFGEQRLSYRELNGRANQLARYLRQSGVGPEVLVGLHLGRSVETIVAMLGVWKAGGAFLPLDPAYPADRLAFMIDDAKLRLVLTKESLAGGLPDGSSQHVHPVDLHVPQIICLDSQWGAIGKEKSENLVGEAEALGTPGPDHLAYVIYTSGSTGRPKGVELVHRGLVNGTVQCMRGLGTDRESRVLQFSSLSFDGSVWEITMALCAGGTLCLAEKEEILPGPQLLEKLRQLQISHLAIPPSSLALLPYGDLPALRVLCVAGEACPAELVPRWGPGRRLFNLYGPTEGTITATWHESGAGDGARQVGSMDLHVPPPIGRPIGNVRVYVLDRNGQVVPVGVPGELHLGGVGVARGYRNRPELTAEKFIANPIPEASAARLYRTGDLVRYRPDGNMEYLGRLDHQVKIRGFRIELGEIEGCLRRHPAIRDAAVLAREDSPGGKRLVAYVVAKGDESEVCGQRTEVRPPTSDLRPPTSAPWSIADLRSHIKQELPEFMVPSAFVTLKALPLTPNGKVDRRALPAPDAARPQLEHEYQTPRTRVEVVLARIWAAVLGLEQVGIHDNFFELGGNSLLAAHAIDRVQKVMRKAVPLATIFRAPTIAALATEVESGRENAFDLLEPIRPTGNGAVVLCFGGGLMDHLPELVPADHPLYWCRPEHVDGKRTRYSDVEDIAAHYCREISAATLEGPYVLCGFSFGGLVAFEAARQLYERDRASSLLFLVEPSLPPPCRESPLSKIVHHLRDLPSVAPDRRTAHLRAKANACAQLVCRWTRRIYCAARLSYGLSVPVGMRWSYAEDQYRLAAARYLPRSFPGRLVLVKRKEYPSDYVERWAQLAAGGFSMHEMSAPGHADFMQHERVIREWGNILQQHLKLAAGPS